MSRVVVLAHKFATRRVELRHHVRVDFVSMTVALVDVRNLAVETGADAFLRLEDCSSAAETHRAAHVRLASFGIKMDGRFFVSGSISVECASAKLSTWRAYSMTIHCMPRQMPRYGTLFSLANLPRSSCPPCLCCRTTPARTPCAFFMDAQAASYFSASSCLVSSSKSLASIHNKSSLRSHAMEL